MISFGCTGNSAVNNSLRPGDNSSFILNGYLWTIRYVSSNSNYLIDRTGQSRLATTDPIRYCVFLSSELGGRLLRIVLTHELGHCAMFSYGLLPAIHSFVRPDRWIEAEEWVCNFIADYGDEIMRIVDSILSPPLRKMPRYSS